MKLHVGPLTYQVYWVDPPLYDVDGRPCVAMCDDELQVFRVRWDLPPDGRLHALVRELIRAWRRRVTARGEPAVEELMSHLMLQWHKDLFGDPPPLPALGVSEGLDLAGGLDRQAMPGEAVCGEAAEGLTP